MLIFHNLPPSSINLPLLQDSNSRPLVYKSSALSVLPQLLSIRSGLNNLSELQRTVQRLDVIFLDKSCKFDNLISLQVSRQKFYRCQTPLTILDVFITTICCTRNVELLLHDANLKYNFLDAKEM